MASVSIDVPDDLLAKLRTGTQDASQALRLAAAFSLCSRGQLSTSQAARLAGCSYADFLMAAGQAKVELYAPNIEDLVEEAHRDFALGRQHVADFSIGQRSRD